MGCAASSPLLDEKDELKETFRLMDLDGDGKLTLQELMKAFDMIGICKEDDPDAVKTSDVLKALDTDGDSCLTVDEFVDNMPEEMKTKLKDALQPGSEYVYNRKKWARAVAMLGPIKEWKLDVVFELFDVNGDGSLTVDEMAKALDTIGPDFAPPEPVLRAFDRDNNVRNGGA